MRLRHFYRINHKSQPIPGSNVKRKSKPGNQWKEILDPCCTTIQTIDCTCGPRFFVQLDGSGKPVPGSLIKRNSWPKMEENIRFQEINWESECCDYVDVVVNFPNSTEDNMKVTFIGLEGQGTYTTGYHGDGEESVTVHLPGKGKYDITFEVTTEILFGQLCMNESVIGTSNFGSNLCRSGAAGTSTRNNVNLDLEYTLFESA